MNRRSALAAVLALAGTSFLFLAPVADAVGEPTSSWWSRLATNTPTDELPAAPPVPAPATPDTVPAGATVPDGQLVVEGAPDGASAIAAARWELGDGESSPSLTLPVGEGSTLHPESIVLACKAATPWSKPEAVPGMWDQKPLVDGFQCVNGIIAEDLSSVAFGVQPLVSGNVLDVVLVPGKGAPVEQLAGVPEPPADVDGSVFRWMFDAPSADNVQVVAGSDFSDGAGDRVITPPTSPTPDFGPVDPLPSENVSATDGPETSPPFEGPEQAVAPALPEEDLAASPPDARQVVPAAASGAANRTVGWILLALAGLVGAWAYLTSAGSQPDTIGLGRFRTALPGAAGAPAASAGAAGGAVGGLSRFARPRQRPPTPLS